MRVDFCLSLECISLARRHRRPTGRIFGFVQLDKYRCAILSKASVSVDRLRRYAQRINIKFRCAHLNHDDRFSISVYLQSVRHSTCASNVYLNVHLPHTQTGYFIIISAPRFDPTTVLDNYQSHLSFLSNISHGSTAP